MNIKVPCWCFFHVALINRLVYQVLSAEMQDLCYMLGEQKKQYVSNTKNDTCAFCFVLCFCLCSAAVSLQGNLTFNCCAEVALPDVPVLMRREDEETAVCTDKGKKEIIIIINLLHLYSAFLDTQSALHSKGAISSSTTNVQHPPGWCDGSHSAPERPPLTSLLVERRQSDEANQCMKEKEKTCAFTFYRFSDAKRTSFYRKSNII